MEHQFYQPDTLFNIIIVLFDSFIVLLSCWKKPSSCTKVLQDLCKATRTSAQILHRWIEDWIRPALLFRMVDGSHNHHNIEYFFINAFIWSLSTWDGRSSPSGSLEKRSGLPSIQTFSKYSTFPTYSMQFDSSLPSPLDHNVQKSFQWYHLIPCHTMSYHLTQNFSIFEHLDLLIYQSTEGTESNEANKSVARMFERYCYLVSQRCTVRGDTPHILVNCSF